MIAEQNPQRAKYLPALAIFVFLATYLGVLLHQVFSAPLLMPDEMVIAGPALNHIRGIEFPGNLYGFFPYYVYELYFRIIALFSPAPNPLPVAIIHGRVLNSALSIINLALFYLLLRQSVKAWYAVAGTMLLALMPAYVFCSVFLKTETLQLLQITMLLLVASRMSHAQARTWYHVAAGVVCAMAVATKYNIFVVLIYASAWAPSFKLNRKTALRNFGIFAITALVSVFILWPGILDVIRDGGFRGMERDQYFLPLPTISRAVDETWAFPWGRFSYSLTVLPVAAGYAPFLLALLAVLTRSVGIMTWLQWGLFSLVYLLVYHLASLIRTGYVYNTLFPFIVMVAISALSHGKGKALKAWGSPHVRAVVLGLAIGLTAYQSFSIVKLVSGIIHVTNEKKRLYGPQLDMLITSTATLASGLDPTDLEGSLRRKQGKYLLVLDSYLLNYCKYRHNASYAAQCDFFRRLLAGHAGYVLEEQIAVDFPLKSWIFDPEGSYTFTLFRRIGS